MCISSNLVIKNKLLFTMKAYRVVVTALLRGRTLPYHRWVSIQRPFSYWPNPPLTFAEVYNSFFYKRRQTATCSASFGCVWSLGAWLPYVSPTNGPWACLEVLAGSAATRIPTMLVRETRPLPPSAGLREGRTWSGEGGRGHPPSQPDQPNQP